MANEILSQEYLKSIFEYKDGILYWKAPRKGIKIGDIVGGQTKHYKSVVIDKKRYYLHRIIYMMFHGFFPCYVDHIDGNKFNNKIENLRQATQSQNLANRKLCKKNKSGAKNVYWAKSYKKWEVMICVNKKRLFMGRFNDLNDAIKIAEQTRNKFNEKFARHT
jgi:hypothetical protein